MRNQHISIRHLLPMAAAIAVFTLTACGPGKPAPTPTMSVDAIYTAAFQTLTSQQATQIALTPPTVAPTDTPFPTLAPPPTLGSITAFGSPTAALSGGGVGCDSSVFAGDITVPDGTSEQPGKKFTKTWNLMNNGTCDWTTSYKLAFVDGDQMGGTSVPVPSAVPAGTQIQISVALTAPTASGEYKGRWQLQNAASQPFGNIIWVDIKVGNAATNTPGTATTSAPSATATSQTPNP